MTKKHLAQRKGIALQTKQLLNNQSHPMFRRHQLLGSNMICKRKLRLTTTTTTTTSEKNEITSGPLHSFIPPPTESVYPTTPVALDVFHLQNLPSIQYSPVAISHAASPAAGVRWLVWSQVQFLLGKTKVTCSTNISNMYRFLNL